MNILSPVPRKRGRIEIIPLIDIMFFLLAAFMMVSIHKVKVKMLKVSLPTDVPVSQLEPKEEFITLSIDPGGHIALEKEMMPDTTVLLAKLKDLYAKNKDQKFLIAADRDARNGDVITALSKLRIAGFQHVAFNLKNGGAKPAGSSSSEPEAPPAPAAPESTAPPALPPLPTLPTPPSTSTLPAAPTPPAVPTDTTPAAPTAPPPPTAAAPAAPAAPEASPAAPAAPPTAPATH